MRPAQRSLNARVQGTLISFLVLTLGLYARPVSAQQEQVFYYHLDAIGSVRMITDANGQVVEHHDYLPFGQEWQPPTPPSSESRLFTGKEHDAETQFDYSGARYYAYGNGRFTTVDPSHVAGDIFNPQTWNGYAYALNNPVRYLDRDGYSPSEWCPGGIVTDDGCFDAGDFRFAQNSGQSNAMGSQSADIGSPNWTSTLSCRSLAAGDTPRGSLGSWASGVGTAAYMTAEWGLGVGPTDIEFGPNSVQSLQMMSAYGLAENINSFLNGGASSGLQPFGLSGLIESGLNPTTQFVGSYQWSAVLSGGKLNITITNSTTRFSAFYHAPGLDPNPPTRTGWSPTGRVNQRFRITVPCP